MSTHDELRRRHVAVEYKEGPLCRLCQTDWPCPIAQLLDENAALLAALADHEYCQWDGIRGDHCQSCEARAGAPHTDLCSWKALGDAS